MFNMLHLISSVEKKIVLILMKGREATLMMVEVEVEVTAAIVEVVVKAIVGILLKEGVGVVVTMKMMHLPWVRRAWMRMVKRSPSTTPNSVKRVSLLIPVKSVDGRSLQYEILEKQESKILVLLNS